MIADPIFVLSDNQFVKGLFIAMSSKNAALCYKIIEIGLSQTQQKVDRHPLDTG
jgi:hypothetical protein